MTNINVMIELLEMIILVPIFIAMLKVTDDVAEIIIDHSKVNARIFSVCLSLVAVTVMKAKMMEIILLTLAILGAVFFLIPIVSFIARIRQNRTKKHKKRWSRYATKDYWKDRLKMAMRKTLKSIWDVFAM